LNESFLGKNEKELHKIRIMVKKCRYSENLENLKPLQDALGKMHDYYNCERLLIKLKQNPKKAIKKKQKWLKKAEKIRINLTKSK
jgi:CHAD domain-containing protein